MSRRMRPQRRQMRSSFRARKRRVRRAKGIRKDWVTIVTPITVSNTQSYDGGHNLGDFQVAYVPKLSEILSTVKNNMNPMMYQYVKMKSITVKFSKLRQTWYRKSYTVGSGDFVQTYPAEVVPIHSRPAFPPIKVWFQRMDRAIIGPAGFTTTDERLGYSFASGLTGGGSDNPFNFNNFITSCPKQLSTFRPGRSLSFTVKESRNRWMSPSNWLSYDPTFFSQNMVEVTYPQNAYHESFSTSLLFPFFNYRCAQPLYTIDDVNTANIPEIGSTSNVLGLEWKVTWSIKWHCKLLRSDTVTTVVPHNAA